MTEVDPSYRTSTAIHKLLKAVGQRRPLRLALLDIDGTLTGTVEEQRLIRRELEARHYVIVFVTSRTSELCMSASLTDLATADSQQGLLDPDIIAASLGGELRIKQQNGGYSDDRRYQQRISYTEEQWQSLVNQLLPQLEKTTNIITAPFRIQPIFSTAEDRTAFLKTASTLPVHITDDSYPYDTPPLFSLHLSPPNVHKKAIADWITEALAAALKKNSAEIELLIAGDGPPDLAMGLSAGGKASATFIIPGKARLARYITENNTEFLETAFHNLSHQLTPLSQLGYYSFNSPNRLVIVGDEAFPGTAGPTTLLSWLRTQKEKQG